MDSSTRVGGRAFALPPAIGGSRLVQRGPSLVVATVLAANGWLLHVLGIPLLHQGIFLAEVALLTVCGLSLVAPRHRDFPDGLTFLLTCFILGLILVFVPAYVLYHRPIHPFELRQPVLDLAVLLILAPFAASGLRRIVVDPPGLPLSRARWAPACTLLMAFAISVATMYGFANDTQDYELLHPPHAALIANWGSKWDKPAHLIEYPAEIRRDGLPNPDADTVGYRALPVVAMVLAVPLGRLETGALLHAMKPLCFLMYFAFAYLLFAYAGYLFELPPAVCLLVALSGLLLGPIPPWPLSSAHCSAVLGFVWSSAELYHNLPQLFCLVIGGAGIFQILSSVKYGSPLFALGCAFATASFFFKPSLYSIVGPTVILMVPFYDAPFSRMKLEGYAVLFLPLVFQPIYRRLFHIHGASLNADIRPFATILHYAPAYFPDFVADRPVLLVGAVLVCSLALVLYLAGYWTIEALRRIRKRGWGTISLDPGRDVPSLFLGVLFTLGLLGALLLLENSPDRWAENFFWAPAAGYQLLLPIIFVAIRKIHGATLRRIAYSLYALHMAGGLQHLTLWTVRGTFFPCAQ
jgi:hypothetical protein